MFRLPLTAVAAALTALVLSGCDVLLGDSPEKIAATREADGRAIGGACRHAGRAIEDCYALNKKADRAAVFAGWLEMNDYMRENKIETVAPSVTPPVGGRRAEPADGETEIETEVDGASAPEGGSAERKPGRPASRADSAS